MIHKDFRGVVNCITILFCGFKNVSCLKMVKLIYEFIYLFLKKKLWVYLSIVFLFNSINYINCCQNERHVLIFCESPCVEQVGLSVVRVTFDKFLVKKECVKKATITYWATNSTKENAKEMALHNLEKIYPKDCTYHRNEAPNFLLKKQRHRSKKIRKFGDLEDASVGPVKNDNRYVYLYGLTIGETYSIQLNVKLREGIHGRFVFSSLRGEITLSTKEPFKSDGLVGHVNQKRCCEIRNVSYAIDSQNGECMHQHISSAQVDMGFSAGMITGFTFLAVLVFIIIGIRKISQIFQERRSNQVTRFESPEVSIKYTDHDDLYQDLSISHENAYLNLKLLKSPTMVSRLPPDGEEYQFVESRTRTKRKSI